MPENVCVDDGLLVGVRFPLPTDEHEFRRNDKEIIGCNRIFCENCESRIKHIDRYRIWGQRLQRADHERLYETLDPSLFGVLRFDPEVHAFRTYLCRCKWANTPGLTELRQSDIDGWSCAGHPSH